MKFTEITYRYRGKQSVLIVSESDYRIGDIGYYEGVLNHIESLTDAGAVILDVFSHR